jgi:hypothetical protein
MMSVDARDTIGFLIDPTQETGESTSFPAVCLLSKIDATHELMTSKISLILLLQFL